MRPRIAPRVALGALLFACALHAPAAAQVSPAERPPPGAPTSSLTVGYFSVDFRYAAPSSGQVYAFDGPATALMLSGDNASLSVAYGSAESPIRLPVLNRPDADSAAFSNARLIDVALIGGGNVTLLGSQAAGAPLRVFVPIRTHLGYRNLALEGFEADDPNRPPTLHLAGAALGAGAGGQVRVPTPLPLLPNNIVGTASLVVAYGGMTDVAQLVGGDGGSDFSKIHLTRSTDFNLEAKVERLLGASGVTVGYTLRTTGWSDGYIESFGQSVRDAQDLDTFAQRSRQHLVRVGLNW